MRAPITISILMHLLVFLLAWVGLPVMTGTTIEPEQIIEVELVDKPETKEQEIKETPKPKPKLRSGVHSDPQPPSPATLSEAIAVPVPGNASEKIQIKEPTQPLSKQNTEQKLQPKSPPRPRMKPKIPSEDLFSSVMRSVEKLEKQKPKKKLSKAKDFDKNILDVLRKHKSPDSAPKPDNLVSFVGRVTQSDKNAIRRQIEKCWNPPVGAKNAEELTVELRLHLTPDGMVQTVDVPDKARAGSDPYFRAAVESAYRAVLNPRCRQLKFPLEKYEQFKTMTIVFDPREMLGR